MTETDITHTSESTEAVETEAEEAGIVDQQAAAAEVVEDETEAAPAVDPGLAEDADCGRLIASARTST